MPPGFLDVTQVKTASGDIWFLFVLAVLLGFASISTDAFLPALPTMQVALQAG